MAATSGNTWNEYVDQIDSLMTTGKYGSRAAAGAEVRRLHPEFRNATPVTGTSAGPKAGLGSSEGQADRLAKEIRQGNPALTKEQAYAQALRENPEVYEQYLRENPAQRLHS